MGSAESAGRTASFGLDEDERVRILRGVKLSEDVLQRMRGVANIAPERTPSSSSSSSSTGAQKGTGASRSSSSSSRPSQNRAQSSAQSSPQSSTRKPNPYTKEEQKRYEQKQKLVKEELAKMAKREREAFQEMNRQRQNTRQEAEKTKQLVQQLQKKDSQLKALDAFYREQLAQLEKRNRERYEHSKEQFHQAAAKTEANVRARNTDPVCAGLQAQILSCYRENGDQTLRCSDLAKAYMQCISAAKKNILVNHG